MMDSKAITWVLVTSLFTVGCGGGESSSFAAPQVVASESYEGCFNGAGFFEMDFADLATRLPAGYAPLDGSFLGPEYAGKGLLAMVYLSCPLPSGGAQQWAVIATPIEDPAITADLRPVRWNWYEVARLEGDPARVETLSGYGFSVQRATFSHDSFAEGDTESRFTVSVPGGTVLSVTAALTDSVNFEAQSHRFWHVAEDGRLLSTRLDFEYHHSWVGSFRTCELVSSLLEADSVRDVECSAVGVTEAIETIDFAEQIVLWN